MTSGQDIVIVGAARTPMGAFQGGLAKESGAGARGGGDPGGARRRRGSRPGGSTRW